MLQSTQPNTESSGGLQDSSLRDLLLVVFRHKKKVISFFVIVVGFITLATYVVPETYESKVRLLVKPGRENLVDPTTREDRMLELRRTMEEYLQSESVILKSSDTIQKVVDKLTADVILASSSKPESSQGFLAAARRWTRAIKSVPGRVAKAVDLVDDLNPEQKAVLTVKDNLKAEAVPKSQVLLVTYECESPELAEKILDEVIKAYLSKRQEIYETGNEKNFMEKRVKDFRAELAEAEKNLRDYKNQHNIVSLQEQRLSRINRLQDLDTAATDVASRFSAAQARVAELEKSIGDVPETVVLQEVKGAPNFYTDDARQVLLQLRLQEREALQQYPEDSRFVQNIRSRIREAEKALQGAEFTRTETTTGVNTARQELMVELKRERAEMAALENRQKVLNARIETLSGELNQMNEAEFQLNSRERDVELALVRLKEALSGLQEAEATQDLREQNITSVALVESVSKPITPVSPNKPLNILLALFLGFFGGIGLAFVADWLDHSLRNEAQIEEKLGIPSLTSVPLLPRNSLKI